MSLQSSVTPNLNRRAGLVSDEVDEWQKAAEQNIDGQGIHRSQVRAIRDMLGQFLAEQKNLMEQVVAPQSYQDFARTYENLVNQIVGVNLIWNLFRTILNQHQDERFKDILTAADLIASDCYLTCMRRAEQWQLIRPEEYRVPPLVYLGATTSPLAAGTGKQLSLLDTRIDGRDAALPIPVLDLPFDHTRCVWLLCSIHHEVGHLVDQELQLSSDLDQLLVKRLQQQQSPAPPDRIMVWQRWTQEILADTFGVLLGGAGFVYTLATLILPPAPDYPILQRQKPHPDAYVRLALLLAMLRKAQVAEWTAAADAIDQSWYSPHQPKPDWIEPYVKQDCDTVADVFLNGILPALTRNGAGHSLGEMVQDRADDAKRASALGSYLGSGLVRPDPKNPHFPWRLVPVAAQLAALQASDADALDAIQQRALQYLAAIKKPPFLAVEPDRSSVTRRRAGILDFGALLGASGAEEEANP
jgi:hypothetical protein